MKQNQTQKMSKHILQHMKKHIEGGVGGEGVHIRELTKALDLPGGELHLAIEFLYSEGLILYISEDMFKLSLKGMVTTL
jgi:replication protein A-like